MIVLLILSIVALYIFGKKWWIISSAEKIDKDFMKDIKDYLLDGKVKSAKALCGKFDSPIARMIETGIARIGKPLSDVQTAVDNVGNAEIARLENGLPYLATIAGGAPMLGFLGTVTGMIKAFFNMANAGNNIDISLLSGGIYEAMITTVGGLIVGLIAYFAYNFLTAKVSNVVFKMENATIDFMDLLSETSGEQIMALRRNTKADPNMSMSSMTDIVFLLLIFFLVTSTLVNPNALKLLLPKSTGQVSAKATVSVSIKDCGEDVYTYHINGEKAPIAFDAVEDQLIEKLSTEEDPTFSIYADESVPIKEVVEVMNIAKRNHYKVILATSPE